MMDATALVLEHHGWARRVAARTATRFGVPGHRQEDFVSAGMVGLVESANRFEDGRGVGFRDFARRRIVGAVIDELRSTLWGPRRLSRHGTEATSYRVEEEPSEFRSVVSLDAPVTTTPDGGASIDTLGDAVADRGHGPEELVLSAAGVEELRAACVDDRERFIVERVEAGALKIEIARALGVTAARVSQHIGALRQRRAALSSR